MKKIIKVSAVKFEMLGRHEKDGRIFFALVRKEVDELPSPTNSIAGGKLIFLKNFKV